ncbi:hypothetical protein FLJC2902T_25370 [Flavobacterium limnosediminis JC2902]|uniref:Uncharacterized protein n=1 Tax=Flavobacterium limnosediminis JC2902 TaxID=1341181 RepID=V6SQ66_9FLAO|nr:hypothetical protein FLJC2902T_25370 [Flavobacterium limnosediminis JC2902]
MFTTQLAIAAVVAKMLLEAKAKCTKAHSFKLYLKPINLTTRRICIIIDFQ